MTRLRMSRRCFFPPEKLKREPAHGSATTKEVVPREERGRTKPSMWKLEVWCRKKCKVGFTNQGRVTKRVTAAP